MHLSLLSDGYLSDSVADAGSHCFEHDLGRVHRDGLLRGLLAVAALALPLVLTMALSPSREAKIAAPAPTSLHVVHLRMT